MITFNLAKLSGSLRVANRSSTYRLFSWKSRMEEKQVEKQKQEFLKEINFLATKNKYTLHDFRQRVLDGLSKSKKNFLSKVNTSNDQTESNLISQRKILNAMFEPELLNPEKITRNISLIQPKRRRKLLSLLSVKSQK